MGLTIVSFLVQEVITIVIYFVLVFIFRLMVGVVMDYVIMSHDKLKKRASHCCGELSRGSSQIELREW